MKLLGFAVAFGAIASLQARADTVTNTLAANTAYTLGTDVPNTDGDVIFANAGATLNVPYAITNIYPHLVVSGGEVTLTTPAGDTAHNYYRFISGIRGVDGGSLKVSRGDSLHVGRGAVAEDNSNYPLCDIADIHFANAANGQLRLRDKVTVRLLPETCPVVVSTDSILAIATNSTAGVYPLLPLGITNELNLAGFDVVALDEECLPFGCRISVPPGRTFAFRPSNLSEDGRRWNPDAGNHWSGHGWHIELGGAGAKVRSSVSNAKATRIMADLTGTGELLLKPETGAGTTVFRGVRYTAAAESPISIPIAPSAPAPTETAEWTSCTNKISFWFDASESDTMIPFSFDPGAQGWAGAGWATAVNEFNGNKIVIGWKPKYSHYALGGPGDTKEYGSFYNQRIWDTVTAGGDYSGLKDDYMLQTMPYLVEGGLNGKDYLSFGLCGFYTNGTSGARYNGEGNLAATNENRRLRFWNTGGGYPGGGEKPALPSGKTTGYDKFKSVYCIMVFGSQQGGGDAILGSQGSASATGDLARHHGLTNAWLNATGDYKMTVDGMAVNWTSAKYPPKPNGGWQIASLDMSARDTYVSGIGNVHQDTDEACGGQNYAEIIFFNEKPTAAERAACELYLAEKWGLRDSYFRMTDPDTAFVASAGEGVVVALPSGEDDVDELTLVGGSYSGEVSIPAGKTLSLGGVNPPADADVAAIQPEHRVGWYDPDFEGAVKCDSRYGHDNLMSFLYGRDSDGLLKESEDKKYRSGYQNDTSKNFAPRVVELTRTSPIACDSLSATNASSVAQTRTWLDFQEMYDDGLGNMIRSTLDDSKLNGSGSAIAMRQGFFVTDTANGGGDLISDNANFRAGKVKPRDGNNYANPIWSPSNTLSMTATWLDAVAVDGAATGYNGRPEVLSFTTADSFNLGYIGNYLGYNTELVGEFLLYDTPLGDDERLTVQEYLMHKWFGKFDASKYTDWSGITLTGVGNVRSETFRDLPNLANTFTGSAVGGSGLSFTAAPVVAPSYAHEVGDKIVLSCGAVIEDGATIAIGGADVKPGSYLLVEATSVSLGENCGVAFSGNNPRDLRWALRADGGRLFLDVFIPGMFIMYQ